jgi:hypothetical protein
MIEARTRTPEAPIAWRARSLHLQALPRDSRIRPGFRFASSRLAPLRRRDADLCNRWFELGVKEIDEGAVPGDSAEHFEACPVMGELGAGRFFVKARGWQQRELSDFGDLVRGEDRDGVGAGVRYAIAQLALSRAITVDRWVV